jgi:hypothetical protein
MTDMNLRLNAGSGGSGRTYKWYNGSVLPFGLGFITRISALSSAWRDGPTMFHDISSLVLHHEQQHQMPRPVSLCERADISAEYGERGIGPRRAAVSSR